MSLLKHFDDRPPPEKWPSPGLLVANDSMLLPTSTGCLETIKLDRNPPKRSRSAMPESAQTTNKGTSNDRSLTCNSTSQATKSSVTSAQGSTGNAGVLQPFWNEYTQEQSMKWWLPEKTNCVALESNLWSGSLKRTGRNSWSLVQTSVPAIARPESLQKTCFPSSRCL